MILTVIDKLASSLNRRDETPNLELAQTISYSDDKMAVKKLVINLHNKNKNIQHDCIKVIYEIGTVVPGLIAPYADQLIALLDNKSNRLQWGAMAALDMITYENPKKIYSALAKIIEVADKGSVITNDHCVGILIKLCAIKKYEDDAFSLLNERLKMSAINQLPMCAEKALRIINDKNKSAFIDTLASRLGEIVKEAKRKRVEKVISKLKKWK